MIEPHGNDESLHVQPYADMIDKLTYVQKADFAKRALDLERDNATYKKILEEKGRELNGWISEYRSARAEVERLKSERDHLVNVLLRAWNEFASMPNDLMSEIGKTLRNYKRI